MQNEAILSMLDTRQQIQNAIRFKIFVVNPQKPLRIQQILVKNKDGGSRGKLVIRPNDMHDETIGAAIIMGIRKTLEGFQ